MSFQRGTEHPGWSRLRENTVAVVAVGEDGEIAAYSNRCGLAAAWCIVAPGDGVALAYFGPDEGTGVPHLGGGRELVRGADGDRGAGGDEAPVPGPALEHGPAGAAAGDGGPVGALRRCEDLRARPDGPCGRDLSDGCLADDLGIAVLAGQGRQHGTGLGPGRHHLPPGLRVGELDAVRPRRFSSAGTGFPTAGSPSASAGGSW